MDIFKLSAKAVFGAGAVKCLTEYDGKNVTIIADPILRQNGSTDALVSLFSNSNVFIYWDIIPDPTIESVKNCYEFVLEKKAEVIVAFGGGSAIDTAKAVVLVDKQANGNKGFELVAIPTTAGTGSEITNYSVIKDDRTGTKYALSDDSMIPDLAILDYTFTKSVPAPVTAATGMDVITHALEAYVAKNANLITDSFAEKALELAFANIERAYKDGNDDEARENMMMASYLAGMAFNQAGLGLCHSIAHSIGGVFKIPHGKANAIALPHVIAYNSDFDVPFGTDKSRLAKKYARIAEIIGLPKGGIRLSVSNLIREIEQLNRKLGIESGLLQMGISKTEFEEVKEDIVNHVLADACLPMNSKEPSKEEIVKILSKIYA